MEQAFRWTFENCNGRIRHVEDVRLLDRGFNAWKNAGLPVSAESTPKEAVKDFGVNVPARKDLIIDTQEAKAVNSDKNGRLVSIRSSEVFFLLSAIARKKSS